MEGKLATRADASKHQGDFRKIVQGVNDTLDAVIGPLNVAAKYVDQISKGAIPAKITDTYNGDFNDHQEQPQHLHRRGQRAGGRRRHAVQGGGGRQTGDARRRLQASGRLPQDRAGRQRSRWTRSSGR